MKSRFYYVTAEDYAQDKIPEIEARVVHAVKAALAKTIPIVDRLRMSPKEAVGEFCTQLRRVVHHDPAESAAKGVVQRLACPTSWSSPGVLHSQSDITVRRDCVSAPEVVMTGKRVGELVALATSSDETSAEEVARACLSEMENNLRDAELVIFGGRKAAEAGAALVGEIHDVAARAEEEFGDAA